MLGAIAGDIAGSIWEGGACPPERFVFFDQDCGFTDDTVCTIAVAEALLYGRPYAETLRDWVSRYPNRGYGGLFINWAHSLKGPYNSFGNGGAMRVASVAWLATSEAEVLAWSEASAAVTHNHPEGVRGAQALAWAIWQARQGLTPEALRVAVSTRFNYDLSASVAELRADFGFTTLAEETVPMALIAALEAKTWDEAVQNVVAIGGDSDTLACMAGAVAEALYGLPQQRAQAAWGYLEPDMQCLVEAVYRKASVALPWAYETAKPSVFEALATAAPSRRGSGLWAWLSRFG